MIIPDLNNLLTVSSCRKYVSSHKTMCLRFLNFFLKLILEKKSSGIGNPRLIIEKKSSGTNNPRSISIS